MPRMKSINMQTSLNKVQKKFDIKEAFYFNLIIIAHKKRKNSSSINVK